MHNSVTQTVLATCNAHVVPGAHVPIPHGGVTKGLSVRVSHAS